MDLDVAFVIVTVLAAAVNGYAAAVDAVRPPWLVANMTRLAVPMSQLSALGALKALGAIGLLVGLAVPAVGVAAGVGLTLFFLGAVVTVLRSGWLGHLPYPLGWLSLSATALALRLATM